MVGASFVLGQRHNDRATGKPYESGIVSEGSARLRMTSQFYLMAMLFVIFDLEAVFIFAWAVAVRELGWAGYCGDLAVHRPAHASPWSISGGWAPFAGARPRQSRPGSHTHRSRCQ